MKTLIITLIGILGFTCSVNAQHYNKDGTPDMRYRENKEIYGGSYSTPTPSPSSYSQPRQSTQSTQSTQSGYRDSYPTKQDGTPDMRYKSNREMYGY